MSMSAHHSFDESSMLFIFRSLPIDTLDYVSFPSLLSIFITIFFSNSAFRKPSVAEHNPHTPMNTGSKL